MKLKTVVFDGKPYAEVRNDMPVYVEDDGKEIEFDAPHALNKINQNGGEARKFRTAKEEAEAKLKVYEGLDPDKARDALKTVENIKDGELIAAGKVDEIKTAAHKAAEDRVAAANKAAQEKLETITADNDKLFKQLHAEKIGGSFARSKYIAEKTLLPGPAAEKIFGDYFKIEDNKVVAYGLDGNKVYSRAKPGSDAEFEEAIEMLIDVYPYRDNILRSAGGGSGARPANGGSPGGKTMLRGDFDKLDPTTKMAKMAEGLQVVDN
jgi:hypothetical protein